jgi:hypothetical protein
MCSPLPFADARFLSFPPSPPALTHVTHHYTQTRISLPFVLSEACIILLGSGSFYMQVCKYKRRKSSRLQALGIPPEQWPCVDVLVPCFKEPLAVIEKTLRAALAIDWPANKLTVLLLDDGGSQGNCPHSSFLALLLSLSPPLFPSPISSTHPLRHNPNTQRPSTW